MIATEPTSAAAELERDELLAARERMYRWIDSLAHECRTPLTVISEYCALMQDGVAGEITTQQREFLGIVMERAGDIARLLNDFADLTGFEQGKRRIQPARARLSEILDKIETTVAAQAAVRHVRLRLAAPRDLGDIHCDAELIQRALTAIVCHALRAAGDNGEVRISAEMQSDARKVLVTVSTSAADAAQDGEPAGLPTFSIAAAAALLLAGRSGLQVEQRAGQGTAWSFAVPTVEPDIAAVGQRKSRILLVDDDRAIIDALSIRLTIGGYDVKTAHDGAQALKVVDQWRPDLILLDIRMPVMDGLTTLARLRESATTREIPVVMVSASHDDRRRALDLGAYYFVEKPYDPNVLKLTIASVLRSSEPRVLDVPADSGMRAIWPATAASIA